MERGLRHRHPLAGPHLLTPEPPCSARPSPWAQLPLLLPAIPEGSLRSWLRETGLLRFRESALAWVLPCLEPRLRVVAQSVPASGSPVPSPRPPRSDVG